MSVVRFGPAVRRNAPLLLALAGASGAGKTKSALQLAAGLEPDPARVFFIDTERGRGTHYVRTAEYPAGHVFQHAEMEPPFSPERTMEAVDAAEAAGAGVVILDSASHEYAGEGGLQEIHDEIQIRMATDRETGEVRPWMLEKVNATAWNEPKLRHRRMMSRLLRCRAHVIFCLRAEEKVRFVETETNGRKKTSIVPVGWVPIQEKKFIYEATLSLTLDPANPGRVDYKLPHKINEQHRPYFPEGELITQQAGRLLAQWAAGGEPAPESATALNAVETPDRAVLAARALLQRLRGIGTQAAYREWQADDTAKQQLGWLKDKRPELHRDVAPEITAAYERAAAESLGTPLPQAKNPLENRV